MKMALRCEKCRQIFMNAEDELMLEIDFLEQKIVFLCHNKSCKHENIIDFKNWQKRQQQSPLPLPVIGRY
jgi:hypothetical protein